MHLDLPLHETGTVRHSEMRYSATSTIDSCASTIAAVLTDVSTIGDWNPAITMRAFSDETAQEAMHYRGVIRQMLPVDVKYVAIGPSLIEYSVKSVGSQEAGEWKFEAIDALHTRVTHSFRHSGFLLWLLRKNFPPVAQWRLERLSIMTRDSELVRSTRDNREGTTFPL